MDLTGPGQACGEPTLLTYAIPKILRRARTGILQPPTLPSSPAIHPASLLPCLGYLWRATSCRAGRESVAWPETRGKEVGKHHFSLLLRPMPAPPVVFSQKCRLPTAYGVSGELPSKFHGMRARGRPSVWGPNMACVQISKEPPRNFTLVYLGLHSSPWPEFGTVVLVRSRAFQRTNISCR